MYARNSVLLDFAHALKRLITFTRHSTSGTCVWCAGCVEALKRFAGRKTESEPRIVSGVCHTRGRGRTTENNDWTNIRKRRRGTILAFTENYRNQTSDKCVSLGVRGPCRKVTFVETDTQVHYINPPNSTCRVDDVWLQTRECYRRKIRRILERDFFGIDRKTCTNTRTKYGCLVGLPLHVF